MKLFTKYSRINVMATIFIFLIASVAFYFTLHYVFLNQIDQDLKIEEREIETYVREHNRLPESISIKDQFTGYTPVSEAIERRFTISLMNEHDDKDKEKFRQLLFGVRVGSQWYKATVSKSLEETENLTRSVLIIAFTTILLILLVAFIINRVVLKRIWKPFYHSLDMIKEFKVGRNQNLQLSSSGIDEFQFMNQTLEKITGQAQLDYLSLKTFTENNSHEIQTPLAVIRSKLDLMIQDESLTEKQSDALQAAYNSVQKLTKLNQSLLMLAKIENNQYQDMTTVDLKNKMEEKIADFRELWAAQQFGIVADLNSATVIMNEELFDVLLNNLLSNATKYNFNGGQINVTLNEDQLKIANTSNSPALNTALLYQRFTKLSYGNENNGLGLSIIKQICDTSGFKIEYDFKNQMHIFIIHWK